MRGLAIVLCLVGLGAVPPSAQAATSGPAGPPTASAVRMPQLTGLRRSTAEQRVRALGLRPRPPGAYRLERGRRRGREVLVPERQAPDRQVTVQEPRAGTRVPRGAAVGVATTPGSFFFLQSADLVGELPLKDRRAAGLRIASGTCQPVDHVLVTERPGYVLVRAVTLDPGRLTPPDCRLRPGRLVLPLRGPLRGRPVLDRVPVRPRAGLLAPRQVRAGVRTSADGRTLVVAFVSGSCNVLSHVDVDEGPRRVRVRVFLGSVPPLGRACTAIGYDQRTLVRLARPLGARRLVS